MSFCKRLILASFAATLPAIAPTMTRAQENLPQKLEAIEKKLDAEREKLHIPGVAFVIVKDDKIVYMKGLGYRDVEKKLPVTPDTLFAIGSSTKAFTAATVMMSVDAGKMSLSDSPRKYIPYFKLRDPDADFQITVGDLLCHRSGLDRTDIGWYAGGNILTSKDVIRMAGLARPKAKFGEKFQYQNVMFLTAGESVAVVQKTPWTAFLTKRLLQPLGMKSSVLTLKEMQKTPDYALGYIYDAEAKKYVALPMKDILCVAPAGAINSNLKDMAQWVRFLTNGGVLNGKRLISEKSFAEMTVPRIAMSPAVSYGYGWFLRNWRGHKVVEHGGNIDGFNAQVAYMPDQKLGFVMLTNVSASPLGNVAMETIWQNLVGTPEPVAKPQDAGGERLEPSTVVGTYHLEVAKLDFVVTYEGGKLFMQPTGQPKISLEMEASGRRYKALPPAPPSVFITFRKAVGDPKEIEMVFEQGGMAFACKRVPPAVPTPPSVPITVDALMQKAIEARGGEANLRKISSLRLTSDLALEDQGLTGTMLQSQRLPNHGDIRITLYAVGKKVATQREWFNGTEGADETSFTSSSVKKGDALENARVSFDMNPDLNWKTLFKTVVIKGVEKVGDEEAYLVEKAPAKGSGFRDYYSTKTFMLLRRDSANNVSERYSDYRAVQGVLFPFAVHQEVPGMGLIVVRYKKIEVNVPLSEEAFSPISKTETP